MGAKVGIGGDVLLEMVVEHSKTELARATTRGRCWSSSNNNNNDKGRRYTMMRSNLQSAEDGDFGKNNGGLCRRDGLCEESERKIRRREV
jgi:hypothetical protein